MNENFRLQWLLTPNDERERILSTSWQTLVKSVLSSFALALLLQHFMRKHLFADIWTEDVRRNMKSISHDKEFSDRIDCITFVETSFYIQTSRHVSYHSITILLSKSWHSRICPLYNRLVWPSNTPITYLLKIEKLENSRKWQWQMLRKQEKKAVFLNAWVILSNSATAETK